MDDPKIKTKVIHSKSKAAWNVVGITIPGKYKIARCPYITTDDEVITIRNRQEALRHAEFISFCFNHSEEICINTNKPK